ncbi:hypothetical protein [Methylobacterium gregans]|uniref:Secreted protein n=1 Tax=Methylobacterium gregans TaxID=374424 RepID=A0AA37M9U6_9HYPH|nr:hypothetical protein [Methylobacterium gregans]MDQ0518783.1 hypothetical protein [Methylobacterium gregans]GJD77354.1 hypothetical protein NBEOAGPD_0558 [Methylobacterium gregans]GLS56460.1 hypothetical protein GCM10007886_46450 [Methylobacterium gregans]
MRRLPCTLLLLLAADPAAAQAPRDAVPVCESLVALRQLAARVGEDRVRAAAAVSSQPGCRLVPRDAIGAVEHRAMVGGAPYECLAQATGGCLWVMP